MEEYYEKPGVLNVRKQHVFGEFVRKGWVRGKVNHRTLGGYLFAFVQKIMVGKTFFSAAEAEVAADRQRVKKFSGENSGGYRVVFVDKKAETAGDKYAAYVRRAKPRVFAEYFYARQNGALGELKLPYIRGGNGDAGSQRKTFF